MSWSNLMDPISYRKRELSSKNFKFHIEKMFRRLCNIVNDWSVDIVEWIDEIPKPRSIKKKVDQNVESKEELKDSVYKTLRVELSNKRNGEKNIIQICVPESIRGLYFFLVGCYKIPLLQLVDKPIIFRNKSLFPGKEILRFKNNLISATLEESKKTKNKKINVLGVSLDIKYFSKLFHTKEEFEKFYTELCSLSTGTEYNIEAINLCEEILEEWDKVDVTDVYKMFYGNNTEEKKRSLEEYVFKIKSAIYLDYFSLDHMKYEHLDFEMIRGLFDGYKDDRDLNNKRIRLSEYILLPLLERVYQLSLPASRRQKGIRIKIQPNIILSRCIQGSENIKESVGNIVRYNTNSNPMGEISFLYQVSQAGPGTFSKENVPQHLRDLHDSHFRRLCSVDTPDREGCGVVCNLVPTSKISQDGSIVQSEEESDVTSYSIRLVPFCQYDDPTRLQMAASQIRQSVPLIEPESPWIDTGLGFEDVVNSTFVDVAKEDGIVIYSGSQFLIVVYDRVPKDYGFKVDIFPLGFKELYNDCLDYLVTDLVAGERFKKDDILVRSSYFLHNGSFSYGKNLLTAIMPFFGYNYEDSIIISESASRKLSSKHFEDLSFNVPSGYILLSLEEDKYIPLREVGYVLGKGEVYARVKKFDIDRDVISINDDPIEYTSPRSDLKIEQIRIFPNCKPSISNFKDYVESLISEQEYEYHTIVSKIQDQLSDEDLRNVCELYRLDSLYCSKNRGKYHYKGIRYDGIRFHVKTSYEEKACVGDKLANRHGNKGVIALVLPDEMMPELPDGRRVEIVINPLGIISRMNVGQLYEMTLGESLYHLRKIMKENKSRAKDILKEYLSVLYTNERNIECINKVMNDFENNESKYGLEESIDRIKLYAPPFRSPGYKDVLKVLEMVGGKEKVQLKVTNPWTGEKFVTENPVSVGYIYFMKLVHRASEKIFARSIGAYNERTMQPVVGRRRQGGHRLGEMEVWALIAHGAKNLAKDLLTIHSDSIGEKIKVLAELLRNDSLVEAFDELETKPRSLTLLEWYLRVCNLDLIKK